MLREEGQKVALIAHPRNMFAWLTVMNWNTIMKLTLLILAMHLSKIILCSLLGKEKKLKLKNKTAEPH